MPLKTTSTKTTIRTQMSILLTALVEQNVHQMRLNGRRNISLRSMGKESLFVTIMDIKLPFLGIQLPDCIKVPVPV